MDILVPVEGSQGITVTGTTSNGQNTVSSITTTGIKPGAIVTGTGIPDQCLVATVTTGSLTLTANATASGSSSLNFSNEPVTLADAKLAARIDITDDDYHVQTLIAQARADCETFLSQTWTKTQYKYTIDNFPMGGGYYNRKLRQEIGNPNWLPNHFGRIFLPRCPLISVDLIQYVDSGGNVQTVDPSVYRFIEGSPGMVEPKIGQIWPVVALQFSSVFITFTAGYTTFPFGMQNAIKTLVALRYWDREGETAFPESVQRMLDPYIHGSYA